MKSHNDLPHIHGVKIVSVIIDVVVVGVDVGVVEVIVPAVVVYFGCAGFEKDNIVVEFVLCVYFHQCA